MRTCEQYTDLLLDSLYGLLDEAEALELRQHLAACPACQAARAAAESQQNLLARAAQVYAVVPVFTAPAAETAVTTEAVLAGATTAAAPTLPAAPATLPLPPPSRRPRRLWLSAAAGLLLAALGIYGWQSYREGRLTRAEGLGQARQELKTFDEGITVAEAKYRLELAALPARLERDYLHVRATGPASYGRSSAGQYRVVTRGPEGRPAPATLTVRLVDPVPVPGRTLFEQQVESAGEQTLTLPAGLPVRPNSLPRLEIEARSGPARARLEEAITVSDETFATHLALDRPAYRTGETVYFRALTLDRFSLKTPEKDLRLTFTLLGPNGQAVRRLDAQAQHGIAAGEFALTPNLAEGQYTLRVAAAAPPAPGEPRILPESRRLRLLGDEAPRLTFNRREYAPGDKGVANFRGRRQANGAPLPNQPVIVEAELNGQKVPLPGSPPGKPLQLRTDADGKLRIPFEVPRVEVPRGIAKDANALQMKVQAPDGRKDEKVIENVPVVPRPASPAPVTIVPFVEGGEPVAGLAARVYFHAHNAQGQPAAVQGAVIDRRGREVAQFQSADGLGGGTFTFTPEAGETYRLRVLLPRGVDRLVDLPAVRPEGVALSVPEAVSRTGEPLRVVVRDSRPGRSLLVVAVCRGRLVDQRPVAASKGGAAVDLRPVAGTRGVVRVTVCEVRAGVLVPLAERLAYRIPDQFLVVSLGANSGQGQGLRYSPAAHVNLKALVKTEAGKAADARLLAAVVDEKAARVAGLGTGPSPAAEFYLTREIHEPADLEEADLLLADTARARQALDLFLGTQGWRRIIQAPQIAPVAALAARTARQQAREGLPAVLIADNNADAVKERYARALAQRRQELRERAERTWAALKEERDRRAEGARLAALELSDYEALPREYLRRGVMVTLLVLFALGGAFLAVGLVRIVRGGRSPAPSFAAAAVALGLCVVAYLLTGDLRTADEEPGRGGRFVQAAPKEWAVAEVPPRQGGLGGRNQLAEQQQRGQLYVLTGEERAAHAKESADAAARSFDARMDQVETKKALTIPARAVKGDFAGSMKGKAKAGAGADDPTRRSPQMSQAQGGRSAALPKGGEGAGGKTASTNLRPAAPTGAGRPMAAKKAEERSQDRQGRDGVQLLREYAHRQLPGTAASPPTLFWNPALHAADGTASLQFDLAGGARTYRVLLYAHDAAGRLGVYQGNLEAGK